MKQLQFLIRPLVVVAVLATAVSLAASTATAQDIRVFRFTNTEADDSDWEVRVSVEAFGGCGEAAGRGSATSGWLPPGDEWGRVFDLNCSYAITAVARDDSGTNRGKICDALVGWGTETPAEDELRSRDAERGSETDVSVRHEIDGGCDAGLTVTFILDPEDVIDFLPTNSRDPALEARAERAVEAADFDVRVTPDDDTKRRRGCNQLHRFTMSGGDDGEYELGFAGISTTTDCTFIVTIEDAPAPFEVIDADGIKFRTGEAGSDGLLDVDISGMVKLPWGRIAIIQDVTRSNNQGHVGYKVARSCAGIDALPPAIAGGAGYGVFTLPGGQVVVSLWEGRFTVHSPNFANFGAGANYLAVARSVTSNVIEGCEVSVTIQYVPDGCTVSPQRTQTLTWRRGNPFSHYDFEFAIDCSGGGRVGAPVVDTDLPPPPPGSTEQTTEGSPALLDAVSDSADVRIIARRLNNGRIEFGLEQRQSDDTWGGRQLPTARLFPATARVDSWLVSSPIAVRIAATADSFAGDTTVRVVARRLQDGRVEFGLQQREDGSWDDRMRPARRIFPLTATTNRWLASSALTLDG